MPVSNSLSEVPKPQWVLEIADWASSGPMEGGKDEGRGRWRRDGGEEEEERILFMGGNLTRGVPSLLAHRSQEWHESNSIVGEEKRVRGVRCPMWAFCRRSRGGGKFRS